MPPARAVSVVMQACCALEEAHAAGIIHRDLKPHNLFMTRVDDDPDFVKLLDFGVARLRDIRSATESLTWSGAVVGTPSYLAPELWLGATADERSDLYALGATLHLLVTGSTPPSGRAALASLDDAPPDAAGRPEGDAAVDELGRIVRRCMATWPEDRYQSAHELHDALRRVHDPAAWTRTDAEEFWRGVDRRRFGAAQARAELGQAPRTPRDVRA
jgi:serine/threonine-protein kinase